MAPTPSMFPDQYADDDAFEKSGTSPPLIKLRESFQEYLYMPDTADGAFLDALAVVASWVRTGVIRDEYRLEVTLRPQLDAPTRIVKQLSSLYEALTVMGHEDPRGLVQRTARDSVPRDRWDALFILNRAPATTRQLCDALGIPRGQNKTVRRMMEDLELLKLVEVDRKPFTPGDGTDEESRQNTYQLTDAASFALRALVT